MSDPTRIECLVCGRAYKALSTHVIRAHGFASAQAYREEFGLARHGLVSRELSARFAANARSNGLVENGKQTRVTAPPIAPRLSREGRAIANANLRRGYLPALRATHQARRDMTRCRKGHPYDEANTAWVNGARRCRTCARLAKRESRQRLRQPDRRT
jgi:hypothetical protein